METAPGHDAPDRLAATDVLATGTIDRVIDSLLGTVPPPYVFAAEETGLCVPVPDSVPIDRDHVISGVASALELCMPADLPAIVDAWTRARTRRGAQTTVHLRRDPERPVTLHFVDARHRYGRYLGVFVGSDGWFVASAPRPALFRPRVCNLRRNEVACVEWIDTAFSQILGWKESDVIGTSTVELVHPDDRGVAIANWMEMLGRPGCDHRVNLRMRHRDEQYIWFEITNRNLLNDPAHGSVTSELIDISDRMEAVEALRLNEQLLRRLTDALPLGVVQIDATRHIVYCNEFVHGILGTEDAAIFDDAFAYVAAADRPAFENAISAVFDAGAAPDVEIAIDAPDGTKRASVAMRALCAGSGAVTGAILCVTDITDRVRLREELERRAKYDTLTRCHNRASILEELEAAMRRAQPGCDGVAVIFVDLDRFKDVNDRYGHAAGDELLRLTGERLLAAVRGHDVVGRIGGDEFLIVCPEVASPHVALEIAGRIAASLRQNTTLGPASIVPGSSIGVAWSDRAIGCDAMVAIADEAMYEAKRGARGPVLALH